MSAQQISTNNLRLNEFYCFLSYVGSQKLKPQNKSSTKPPHTAEFDVSDIENQNSKLQIDFQQTTYDLLNMSTTFHTLGIESGSTKWFLHKTAPTCQLRYPNIKKLEVRTYYGPSTNNLLTSRLWLLLSVR